jgi:hypothetical protein
MALEYAIINILSGKNQVFCVRKLWTLPIMRNGMLRPLYHTEIIDYVPTLSRLPVLTCRCNWLEARAATIIDRTLLESIHNMVVRVKAHFLLV